MNFVVDVMSRNYEVIDLFQNVLILRRPSVAISADVIKIVSMFIKKIFEDSKKVKRIKNYVPKFNLYLCFLI